MNKSLIKVIISWLLVLATMLIIFLFSSENSEQSSNTSQGVIEEILGAVMDKEEITPEIVNKYQLPVRKLAHFGIYMLLGFSLINAFKLTINKKLYYNIAFSIAVSILYAISDEFHQGFSDGRWPMFTDVLIDSSGAIIGIAVFCLMAFFINKKQVGIHR